MKDSIVELEKQRLDQSQASWMELAKNLRTIIAQCRVEAIENFD